MKEIIKTACSAYDQGRWYDFLLESDGSAIQITTSDMAQAVVVPGGLRFPANFHIVDIKVDWNPIPVDAAVSYVPTRKHYANGMSCLTLPAPADMDWLKVYIFGYFS